MDAFSLLRMLGALLLVLGGLVCGLWAVKRYDLTLPRKWLEGLGQGGAHKRLQVVERLAIDQRRSVVLLRRDNAEFSVLIGPEGVTVLERAIPAAEAALSDVQVLSPGQAQTPPVVSSFGEKLAALPDIWFGQDNAADEAMAGDRVERL